LLPHSVSPLVGRQSDSSFLGWWGVSSWIVGVRPRTHLLLFNNGAFISFFLYRGKALLLPRKRGTKPPRRSGSGFPRLVRGRARSNLLFLQHKMPPQPKVPSMPPPCRVPSISTFWDPLDSSLIPSPPSRKVGPPNSPPPFSSMRLRMPMRSFLPLPRENGLKGKASSFSLLFFFFLLFFFCLPP